MSRQTNSFLTPLRSGEGNEFCLAIGQKFDPTNTHHRTEMTQMRNLS